MLSAAFIHLIVAVGPELSRNVGYQTRRPLPRGSPPPEPAPANTHTRDFQGRVLWANADVSFVPLVNPANKIRAAQGWEQLREARGRAPLPTGRFWERQAWGRPRATPSVCPPHSAGRWQRLAAAAAWACPPPAVWQSVGPSSECGPLPSCCCLNCVFPRPGLPELSPAVTSCQPVVSTLLPSLPRDNSHRQPEPGRAL